MASESGPPPAICIAHCFPNIEIIENLSHPRNLSQLGVVTLNTSKLWPIFGPGRACIFHQVFVRFSLQSCWDEAGRMRDERGKKLEVLISSSSQVKIYSWLWMIGGEKRKPKEEGFWVRKKEILRLIRTNGTRRPSHQGYQHDTTLLWYIIPDVRSGRQEESESGQRIIDIPCPGPRDQWHFVNRS